MSRQPGTGSNAAHDATSDADGTGFASTAATPALADAAPETDDEALQRGRTEALLNDSQRLAGIGGWMFDIASEQVHCTEQLYHMLDVPLDTPMTIDETLAYFDKPLCKEVEQAMSIALLEHKAFDLEGSLTTANGESKPVRVQGRVYTEDNRVSKVLGLIHDISDRRRTEARMAQAQKMESVGQLAAGIAHEINTPTQFVQDNTSFLKGAFTDIQTAITALRALTESAEHNKLAADLERILSEADYDFLEAEIPAAIQQSLDGLQRIADLVRAMKDYAHPGSSSKAYENVSRAVQSTVIVARHEWKYVADVDLDLAEDMPLVPCYLADLNQVVLNMIVNAVHAIEERYGAESEQRGRIRVVTRHDEQHCFIEIIDDGNGIPADKLDRIFDPFFTTKEVGKGTGQGLAISHQVVQHHGGEIQVDSTPGVGTTMRIVLPLTMDDEDQA